MAMNPGPDMEHDPQLAEIYRAGTEAGPPARLDEAIRAAARREVNAGPRRSGGLRRWQLPLSLAAVLVLSVTVVTQMREQGADRPEALLLPPADVQPRAAEQSRVEPVPPPVTAVPEAEVRRPDKPAPAADRPAAPPSPAMAPEQKVMTAPAESQAAAGGGCHDFGHGRCHRHPLGTTGAAVAAAICAGSARRQSGRPFRRRTGPLGGSGCARTGRVVAGSGHGAAGTLDRAHRRTSPCRQNRRCRCTGDRVRPAFP